MQKRNKKYMTIQSKMRTKQKEREPNEEEPIQIEK